MEQLGRFPGLVVSVHQLIHNGERVALRFTEHGASARLERRAAWGGVALFESDGSRLTKCFAEEDYLSRRRQLDGGDPDPIDRPATAPWTTAIEPPDPAADLLFSAGRDVAFHGVRRGAAADLNFAGIVSVVGDRVLGGRVVRDRLGFERARAKAEEGG